VWANERANVPFARIVPATHLAPSRAQFG
jgi:hypothetical protein